MCCTLSCQLGCKNNYIPNSTAMKNKVAWATICPNLAVSDSVVVVALIATHTTLISSTDLHSDVLPQDTKTEVEGVLRLDTATRWARDTTLSIGRHDTPYVLAKVLQRI